jgi:hypothetical protein
VFERVYVLPGKVEVQGAWRIAHYSGAGWNGLLNLGIRHPAGH